MHKIIELNGEQHFVGDLMEFIELLPYDSQKPVKDLLDDHTGGEDLKEEFKAYEGHLEDYRHAMNEVLSLIQHLQVHIEDGNRLNRKTIKGYLDNAEHHINNVL
ncbi:hypothetical protein COF68_06225 [Bacillus toyonensis]|uniref:hypothetical protein n=1 Tax=Bacillus toyonensis TaxID=155322 RepID=UPI000BFBE3D2|nr:hypothetical protein [Bacillus toyonensis]PHE64430.1 hypothetical protein COF68_06225 [Bacillus toyonensis]